ncbi:MAG: hypothetical protein WA461_08625 [Nitrososphaeraceae archaeon]
MVIEKLGSESIALESELDTLRLHKNRVSRKIVSLIKKHDTIEKDFENRRKLRVVAIGRRTREIKNNYQLAEEQARKGINDLESKETTDESLAKN